MTSRRPAGLQRKPERAAADKLQRYASLLDKVQNYGFLNPKTGRFKGTNRRVFCKILPTHCNIMVPVSLNDSLSFSRARIASSISVTMVGCFKHFRLETEVAAVADF